MDIHNELTWKDVHTRAWTHAPVCVELVHLRTFFPLMYMPFERLDKFNFMFTLIKWFLVLLKYWQHCVKMCFQAAEENFEGFL